MSNVVSIINGQPIYQGEKITSGSFYTRVLEKIRKDSYGNPVYDFSVKTMLVYCEDAGRCLRVPVISTEGEYHD